jgi:hypothetical protein
VTAVDFPVEVDKPELNQQYSTVLKFGVRGIITTRKAVVKIILQQIACMYFYGVIC